jgi:uncharacterized membrane protein YfcA
MSIIEIIGALVIGLVLGLTGGGGSILAVPFLFYFVKVGSMNIATSYSLFIVGITSAIGSVQHLIKKNIEFKKGMLFAIPAMVMVFMTRKFMIPVLPDPFIHFKNFKVSLDIALLILFAVIMVLAAISMIKGRDQIETKTSDKPNINLIPQGVAVGTITGLVGAGGGFLIVPALVLLAKIPMKRAVATSLLIIFINSTIGFTGDLFNANFPIDWQLILSLSGCSIIGIFIGSYIGKFTKDKSLKKIFGYFILIMGLGIILKEVLGY